GAARRSWRPLRQVGSERPAQPVAPAVDTGLDGALAAAQQPGDGGVAPLLDLEEHERHAVAQRQRRELAADAPLQLVAQHGVLARPRREGLRAVAEERLQEL